MPEARAEVRDARAAPDRQGGLVQLTPHRSRPVVNDSGEVAAVLALANGLLCEDCIGAKAGMSPERVRRGITELANAIRIGIHRGTCSNCARTLQTVTFA